MVDRRRIGPRANASTIRPFVVVPAYNEERTIEEIVRQILPICADLIVVDDGSTDGTGEILSQLPVEVIRHERNLGKGASLLDGMREALARGADAVLTMDADGQHRPADIARLLDRSAGSPDALIVGSRLHDRAAFPAARYHANEIANFWISWAAGQWVEDTQCGMRLYPRKALDVICRKPDRHKGFAFESEALIDIAGAGVTILAEPIPAIYAGEGARPSHFRPVRDIAVIVLMVARRLLARAMYPAGLIASIRARRARRQAAGLSRARR